MRRHPQLGKKLSLLYSLRLNPVIKNHADLAEILGISRQAVGKWARGTETSQGDSIPLSQVENVATIFSISEHWLTLSLEDFESKLYEKLESESRLDSKKPEKISISLLPNTPAKIFGRKPEFKILDAEWNDRRANVLQLVAFGGMGKSSLVNSWLSRLDQKGYCGARRVYAWSFYWQSAGSEIRSSGDYFIEHALGWFGDESPAEGTPWDKALRLANLVRAQRTLLILDGLEPLQLPPGPKHGLVENPAVALLVKELASENNGLCVITSRLPVADLAAFEGARVKTIKLGPLPEKASIKLLKGIGIQGVHSEYRQAVEEYSGHPLSLSLLGGYLNIVHRSRMGDYRKIRSLLDEQEMGMHARNLMRNYLDWFKGTPERALLFVLGLFDRAVRLADIERISVNCPDIEGITKDLARLTSLQYSYAIDRLKQANLITVKEKDSQIFLDCHPLVRDFLSEFIKAEQPLAWTLGHALIFDFLRNQAVSNPTTMAELEPLFRAVIHGTQAGQYEAAFELYFEKIKKRQFSMFTQGSHHEDQACISGFFGSEWGQPVDELPDDAKFYILSCAATNLIYLGEVSKATNPCIKSIDWFRKKEMWLDALNIAAPLASMLIITGNIVNARNLISELQPVVEKSNNQVVEAMSWCFQAHILHLIGEDDEAEVLFEKAENILTQDEPIAPVSFPTISSYYCKFLLETGRAEMALERSLDTMTWRSKGSWQVSVDTTSLLASDLQILGLCFLELGDTANAKVYLDKQLDLLRDADEWLYLPSGLNALAVYFLRIGDYERAQENLFEALEISRRTGARFGEWETCLNLSQLNLLRGNRNKAKKYLEEMRKVPEMESYNFRNEELVSLRTELSCSNHYKSVEQAKAIEKRQSTGLRDR